MRTREAGVRVRILSFPSGLTPDVPQKNRGVRKDIKVGAKSEPFIKLTSPVS
jgi:hypothetical protein